jgi:hypothetical protein
MTDPSTGDLIGLAGAEGSARASLGIVVLRDFRVGRCSSASKSL